MKLLRNMVLGLALAVGISFPAYAVTMEVQENYIANLTITDLNGDHVASETPTLMIRRNSDGYYLDWNDSTFKNSAWTTKAVTMTEDGTNGFYHYTYNPPGSETGVDSYLLVYDNGSGGGYGNHITETIAYIQEAPTVEEIADQVWDETASAHTTADTFGQQAGTDIDAILADTNEIQTNQDWNVWDDGTRTLTALDEDSTTIDLDATTVGDLTTKTGFALSASGVDAIWDEAQSGHVSAGTFGLYLDAQVSSAATPPTANAIADQVWEEAIADHSGTAGSTAEKLNSAASAGDPWSTSLPGAYGAGTAGKIVGDNLDATTSSRATPSDVTVYVGE